MAPTASTSQNGGIWAVDSVRDVADGVGLQETSDEVIAALAGDVEYRLHEVIEEAVKFMRHSKRTVLKAEDVDYALQCRNIDPLWGFSLPTATDGPSYLKTPTANGTIYVQEDEEVDLTKLLSLPMPHLPRQASYTAHWLAVEGVQPAIPSNPSPQDVEAYTARLNNARGPSVAQTAAKDGTEVDVRPLIKHVLSRELQLYFDRLTSALLPSDTIAEGGEDIANMREAALVSLRHDQGLAGLLPYLIQWASEKVTTIATTPNISVDDATVLGDVALGLVSSLMDNQHLFVEPYLHQLMPIILTCLINAESPIPVRQLAAGLLSQLVARHATVYPSLKPRVVKTLLRALVEPERQLPTRYGALLGLKDLGPATIESVLGIKKNLQALGAVLAAAPDYLQYLAVECAYLVVNALAVAFADRSATTPTGPLPTDKELEEYGPRLKEALSANPSVLAHLVDSPANAFRSTTEMEQD